MATAALQNGRLVWVEHEGKKTWWEPTTELCCSFCREPLPIQRATLGTINFTYDWGIPCPLERCEYWYLHKQCAFIDRVLERRWRWLPMWEVLGKGWFGKGRSSKTQKELREVMPPGAYGRLYEKWRPAIDVRKPKPRLVTKPESRVIMPKPLVSKPEPKLVLPKPKPESGLVIPKVKPVPVKKDRPGYVYLLLADGANRIKIGRSQHKVTRIDYLKTGSPFPLVTLRVIPSADHVLLETTLKQRYKAYNVHREWYVLPPSILEALLKEEFA